MPDVLEPPVTPPANQTPPTPTPTPEFSRPGRDKVISSRFTATPPPSKPDAEPDKAESKPKETPPEAPPKEEAAPEEEVFDTPKPETPPAEKKTETPPAKGAKPTPFQLLHKAEAEVKTLRAQVEELTKKTTAEPDEHPKFKSLAEENKSLREKVERLSTDIKFADYQKSQEFKDKYETPYFEAFKFGRAKVASLRVPEVKDDLGTVIQPARQATAEDFDALMSIQDDNAAADFANEKFGSKASIALYQRERVQELGAAAQRAISDFQKTVGERDKKATEQQATAQKEMLGKISELASKHTKLAFEKFGKWFKPVEGDDAGNKLLNDGFASMERAFKNALWFNPNLKPEEMEAQIAEQISIMNKGASFDRLAHQFKLRGTRIKELEAALKAYEDSEPGAGKGRGEKPEKALTGAEKFLKRLKAGR